MEANKQFIRPNRIKKNNINKIYENDIKYETKHGIANVLNSYFVNIDKHLSESMNAGPDDHYQYILKVIVLIHYPLHYQYNYLY